MVINDCFGHAFDGDHDRDAIPDELEVIGIAGDNHDLIALLLSADGECPDDVICLVAWNLEGGYSKSEDKLPGHRGLELKVIRSLLPVPFVVWVRIVAECRRMCIPRADHHIGFIALNQRDEHIGQPKQSIGRFAFAVGQCPHREKGAEEQ